jgi:hypothetical protein
MPVLQKKEVERSLREVVNARFTEKRGGTVVERGGQCLFYRKKRVDGR